MDSDQPTNAADAEPLLEVENLSKDYGRHRAIDGLTFSIPRGEIVGFLGPNGAGKSTTLRILSGFLAATTGTVRMEGNGDGDRRRHIGFMPENNPLHPDMRVREYLKFRARLKGLDREQSRERVTTVIEQFGLEDVKHRMIGELSKGFRQRVGLADALVHEPDLLILDEPTIGLDPQQIRIVRNLIKDLAGRHTVILSSHILPEVEVTCSRLLIFNEGNIVADDTPRALEARLQGRHRVVAELNADREALEEAWEEMAEVAEYRLEPAEGEYHRCVLTPREGEDIRTRVSALARARGWPLREITRERHTLEEIFMHVTQGEEGLF
jgi:ABC-2 type transport system ATP-binding protein